MIVVAAAADNRTLRRRRREDVRSDVIAAMTRLVETAPYRDLTVDEIARSAGLSRSAFYFYFRDKQDLLMAAAAELTDELYGEADRWWHGEGDPATLVREALTGVTSVYARHARLLGVAVEVSTYDDEVRVFWRALIERFIDATSDHLARERAAARLPDVEPRAAAESLVWMAERICWVYLRDGERTVEEVVEQLCATWMAALYPPAAP